MELIQFIKNPFSFFDESSHAVLLFVGAAYPHAFFSKLIEKLKRTTHGDIKNLDIQGGDFTYKANLGTSFLGMQCVYWLGDTTALKSKQKEELLKYLRSYEGPHKVIAFIDAKLEDIKNDHMLVVQVKDKYFFEDAKTLWITHDFQQSQKTAFFLQQLYKVKNSYSLDELFLLKSYQDLIVSDNQEFYQSWVARLVTPDNSLFTLSQLFFEKKEDTFLKMWLTVKDLYADMFWLSFWSDQIYRAYFYIAFTKDENFAAAKQVSFGLSFSFLKQTYKQYGLTELQNMHHALFDVDTALKNGGNLYLLDQLFINFFAGKFK